MTATYYANRGLRWKYRELVKIGEELVDARVADRKKIIADLRKILPIPVGVFGKFENEEGWKNYTRIKVEEPYYTCPCGATVKNLPNHIHRHRLSKTHLRAVPADRAVANEVSAAMDKIRGEAFSKMDKPKHQENP